MSFEESSDEALVTMYLLCVNLIKSEASYSKNLHVFKPPFLLAIGVENFELMTYVNSRP